MFAMIAAAGLMLTSSASAGDRWQGTNHPGDRGDFPHGWHKPGHHHGGVYIPRRNRLSLLSPRSLGGSSRVVSVRQALDRPARSPEPTYGDLAYYDATASIAYLDRGDAAADRAPSHVAPKAKIIHVTQELADGSFKATNGCSYEVGVCVIRGGE
jgi:hypothetical protein